MIRHACSAGTKGLCVMQRTTGLVSHRLPIRGYSFSIVGPSSRLTTAPIFTTPHRLFSDAPDYVSKIPRALEPRLDDIKADHKRLGEELCKPDHPSDKIAQMAQKLGKMQLAVDNIDAWRECTDEIASLQSMLDDSDCEDDLRDIAQDDLHACYERLPELEDRVLAALIPQSEVADRNVVLEVRPGAGGREASLFAGEVYEMYRKYAALKGWNFEDLDYAEGSDGGTLKLATATISGPDAYHRLQYESGVHRVQRVPVTGKGEMHTSTMSVVIMPEAQEVDVDIDVKKDIRIDTFRASGPGGQHVNTTDSAVRITHFESGIVVSMQDGRSQIANKEKALKVLYARLYDRQQAELRKARSDLVTGQIGSGGRNERIRTYHYPQNRVTDHRIGETVKDLNGVMNGELLDVFLDKLEHQAQVEAVQQLISSLTKDDDSGEGRKKGKK